jgi:hypothetical protein
MYNDVTGDAASRRRKVCVGLLCDKQYSCALLARVASCLYTFATASFFAKNHPRDATVPVRPVVEVIDRMVIDGFAQGNRKSPRHTKGGNIHVLRPRGGVDIFWTAAKDHDFTNPQDRTVTKNVVA